MPLAVPAILDSAVSKLTQAVRDQVLKEVRRQTGRCSHPMLSVTNTCGSGRSALHPSFLHRLALCSAAVSANTLRNGWHLDDAYRILDNPGIQRVSPIWRHFVDPTTKTFKC